MGYSTEGNFFVGDCSILLVVHLFLVIVELKIATYCWLLYYQYYSWLLLKVIVDMKIDATSTMHEWFER